MCGLLGFIGKEPADIEKIKILGIYNATRGTDACGIVINDKVVKGVDDKANWTNFIENNQLKTFKEHSNYIILGHTRSASNKTTKDDIDCAHPIVIKTKKNKIKLIGVHNGTISNHAKLAKDYNVKDGKIDSISLMSVLSESKDEPKRFKVFEDYEGAATCMWYHPEEPNVLKIWKGASKEYQYDKEIKEERPLYVYKVNDDTFYFSSIKESLYAIGGDINSVSSVPVNCVITVKPGEKFKILPKNRNKVDDSTNYSHYGIHNHVPWKSQQSSLAVKAVSKQVLNAKKLREAFIGYSFAKVNQFPYISHTNRITIDNEPFLLDQASFGSKIFFWKGRYTRNGHIVGKDKDKYLELELDIYGFEKQAKGKDNPNCDLESLDKYYFWQGFLLLSKEHGDEMFQKAKEDKNGTFLFDNFGKLNLPNISKYIHGFCNDKLDKNGNARDSSTKWAKGDYTPMFDYTRKYTFDIGSFVKAEIIKIGLNDITTALKDFDETKELKKEEKTSVTSIIQYPNYSSSVEDDDKTYNLVQDLLSNVKVLKTELENKPAKFNKLRTQINMLSKVITNSYTDIINNKIQESSELVNAESNLLYS